MRIASLLSIFTAASAPAVPSGSFGPAFQAMIVNATQRQGGNGSTGSELAAPTDETVAAANAGKQQDTASEAKSDAAAASDTTDGVASGAIVEGMSGLRTAVAQSAAQAPGGYWGRSAAVTQRLTGTGDGEVQAGAETDAAVAATHVAVSAAPLKSAANTNFVAMPDGIGDRASGAAIEASSHDAEVVVQPSQPLQIGLSQAATAAPEASVAWAGMTAHAKTAEVGGKAARGSSPARSAAPAPSNVPMQTPVVAMVVSSTVGVPMQIVPVASTVQSALAGLTATGRGGASSEGIGDTELPVRAAVSPLQQSLPVSASVDGAKDVAGDALQDVVSKGAGQGPVAASADAAAVPAHGGVATQPVRQGTGDAAVAAGSSSAAGSAVSSDAAASSAMQEILAGLTAPVAMQPGVAPVQENGSAGGGVKASDLAGAGRTKAPETSSAATTSAPAHNALSDGQPVQHSSTEAQPVAVVGTRSADSQGSQAQTVVAHVVAHDATATVRAGGSGSGAGETPAARTDAAATRAEIEENAPASGIHAASVMQAMNGTEMRVGMRSEEFGNVSIRTSVSPQAMTTQISVDHGDLGQAILAHASSVQARFQEQYGMHASIQVNAQGASTSGEPGGSAQREQQGFVRSARIESVAAPEETEIGLGPLTGAGASGEYRLDIRA